jgi:hypothetical protein
MGCGWLSIDNLIFLHRKIVTLRQQSPAAGGVCPFRVILHSDDLTSQKE